MRSTTPHPTDPARVDAGLTFEEAYRLLLPRVVRYCASRLTPEVAEAEDIASEAFLELQRKWEQISPHSVAVVTAFLFCTAYFKQQNRRRLGRHCPASLSDLPEERLATEDCRPGGLFSVDASLRLEALLSEIRHLLSPHDLAIFQELFLREETSEVVARRHGLTPVALRVRICRMRQRLRAALAEQYGTGKRG